MLGHITTFILEGGLAFNILIVLIFGLVCLNILGINISRSRYGCGGDVCSGVEVGGACSGVIVINRVENRNRVE
jgi:hypothetical protein